MGEFQQSLIANLCYFFIAHSLKKHPDIPFIFMH